MNYEVKQIIADNFAEIERFHIVGKNLSQILKENEQMTKELETLRTHLNHHIARHDQMRDERDDMESTYYAFRRELTRISNMMHYPEDFRTGLKEALKRTE